MSNGRVLGIALLVVALLTLIVFLISSLQPILPPNVNSMVLLFVACLFGVLGVLSNLNDIMELFYKFFGHKSADIRLEVEERRFRTSIGISIPTPRSKFRGVQWKHPRGHNEQGLPDCGSLWARVRIINRGEEDGLLRYEFDGAKLPPLFDCDKIHIDFDFYSPRTIACQRLCREDLYLYVLFTERDPRAFAQALKTLIRLQERYKITIRYWTERFDGKSSRIRKLDIEGDFTGFYQEMLEYWEGSRFRELAEVARFAES